MASASETVESLLAGTWRTLHRSFSALCNFAARRRYLTRDAATLIAEGGSANQPEVRRLHPGRVSETPWRRPAEARVPWSRVDSAGPDCRAAPTDLGRQ